MIERKIRGLLQSEAAVIFFLSAFIWLLNGYYLLRDTRPPVWDMAMHQSYALNYLPGWGALEVPAWERSGTYPPFVHLAIAFAYLLFGASPDVAVLANLPATLLLLWAVYQLGADLAGRRAARWACLLTAFTPYLIWMSRETILDYWLSAWLATSLVVLRRTHGFESRPASLLLGLTMALGLLTKWFFAAFIAFPLVYTFVSVQVWKRTARMVNFLDMALLGGAVSCLWYLPNIPRLVMYFHENMGIGAREGEPPVLSFQSFIYYLRLLEGYQLFAVLFVLFGVSCIFVFRKRLVADPFFWTASVAGAWLILTLLRTKDARFTMPLLGLTAIIPGAWLASWRPGTMRTAAKGLLFTVLAFQVYATNIGVKWLPDAIVLAPGYQGSLRWDWNILLQDCFGILGPPRREDWKQGEILARISAHSLENGTTPDLAVIPDLPHFSAANFHLHARLRGMNARVDHPQSAAAGVRSLDGFHYVLMTEGNQGIAWTTGANRDLNQIIVDKPTIFRLLELYPMPNGDSVRLYHIVADARPNDRS